MRNSLEKRKLRAVGDLMKQQLDPLWNSPRDIPAAERMKYVDVPMAKLWATLISESTIYHATKSVFQRELREYKQANECNTSVAQLLKRAWIREINGEIRLPGVILQTVRYEPRAKKAEEKLSKNDGLILKFLTRWYSSQRMGLYFSRQKLEHVLKSFVGFGIGIEWLIEQGVIGQEEDTGTFRVAYAQNISFKEISDQVMALLLRDHQGGIDTVDRLRDLMRRIDRTHGFWPFQHNHYIDNDTLKRVSRLSYELLANESDLKGSTIEIQKAYLDADMWKEYKLFDRLPAFRFAAQDHYELIGQVKLFEHSYHDLFSEQRVRGQYSFLIRLIVANENWQYGEANCTLTLLHDISKPFVVYELVKTLAYVFPHIIPMLLLEEETTATAFYLLNEVNLQLNEQEKELIEDKQDDVDWIRVTRRTLESIDSVWERLFKMYLIETGRSRDFNQAAYTVQRILIDLSMKAFTVNTGNEADVLKHRVRLKRYNASWEQLRNQERINHFPSRPLWLDIISPMVVSVCHEEIPNRFDGTRFPSGWIDYNAELLKTIDSAFSGVSIPQMHRDELPELDRQLTQSILGDIDRFFNAKQMTSWDAEVGRYLKVKRTWSDMDFGIELIEWPVIFDRLGSERVHNLHKEIVKRIRIKASKHGLYDDENLQHHRRARVYLRLLTTAMIQLIKSSSEPRAWRDDSITKTVIDLVLTFTSTYNTNALDKGRFDVLENALSATWAYDPYRQSDMDNICVALSHIAEADAMNYVKGFIESNTSLLNLIKIYMGVEHKQVRVFVMEKVQAVDIDQFLKTNNWGIIRSVLVETAFDKALSEISDVLLPKYEAFVAKIGLSFERADIFFQLRLAIAVNHGKREELEQLELPKSSITESQKKKLRDMKTYYIDRFDLAQLKDAKDVDLQRLEALARKYPEDIHFVYNYQRSRMKAATRAVSQPDSE